MRHTFMHKLILVVLAGLMMATLIQFYKVFIVGADRALNEGYNNRYGISR